MGLVGQNPAAAGFGVPPDAATQVRRVRDLERAVQQMFADGTLRALIDSLPASIAAIIATSVSTGTVTASSTITATGDITSTAGRGTFASGLSSVGASATDLTALSGLRQITYQIYSGPNIGLFGYAPSTIHSKTNLSTSLPFSAADVFEVIPYMYEYIGQVAIRDDPENENYDPDYIVPMEIGLMAEHLVQHKMRMFVVFNEDGSPKTIDYAAFGAIANLVAVRDLNERLRAAGL